MAIRARASPWWELASFGRLHGADRMMHALWRRRVVRRLVESSDGSAVGRAGADGRRWVPPGAGGRPGPVRGRAGHLLGRDRPQLHRGRRDGVHTAEITPPLSFLLTWLTTRLGESPELVRLPALVAGIAAIPLVYLLGVLTVGRRAALLGATLTALSPFMIFYSAEARATAC